jgi:dephospho-CoA kinase
MAILRDDRSRRDGDPMLTIGLTGGMGSGKSVVCDMLEARGARVFDADEVGKDILRSDPEARREIVRAFGERSYRTDGSLDRGYLAGLVFGDERNLARINSIVHPRVFAAFERERETARAEGVKILVHEAALLFESGGDRYVDVTVYVDAPRWLRIRRVIDRDGRTRAEVIARMRHQLPAYKGRARADFVLQNDGTLDQLEQRVERLLVRVRHDERAEGVR